MAKDAFWRLAAPPAAAAAAGSSSSNCEQPRAIESLEKSLEKKLFFSSSLSDETLGIFLGVVLESLLLLLLLLQACSSSCFVVNKIQKGRQHWMDWSGFDFYWIRFLAGF